MKPALTTRLKRRPRTTARRTVAAFAAAFLLAGCAGTTGDTDHAAAPTASAAEDSAYPVTVGKVTLAHQPHRIVSLSPSSTEMLFAVGAGPQVVAVDDQSDYPAGVPKSNLSGFKPSAEAIAAKNPDLVVLSDDIDKIVDQLAALKIPVFQTPAAALLADSYAEIDQIGTLTGHAAAAVALTGRMRAQIAATVQSVPERARPLTYYYELDPTFYTVTSKTFIGSIFAQLGMVNVADPADPSGAKGGYPQLSQETLIKANPDMIFLADSKCCKQSAGTVAKRTGWSGVGAVKNGRVVALDDDVASRWGPRVVELVRAVADAVAKVPA